MSNWHVGQQVYCLKNGAGVITMIETAEHRRYPVLVKFPVAGRISYTLDGRYMQEDLTPMLYPSKPEITVPKWQPKPGEWCWFWDEGINSTLLAQLSHITARNNYETKGGSIWQHCAPFNGELPEHLKEVQP